ncbi:hypothetical protein pVco7_gp046 [Vibrio phage pVco-7]|uniref:Uncharacterized protein n=1 Tax=Vibrio phage pVco-5 TaxID=1965485 RepID=A0A1W6JV08_9CAUD|nr:hypothetical protein KNT61_gp047 [Vibrio phage pVco-5]ARM71035.1 hypothetical protein pVco5_047 [Vibrio phage pVco-5]
MRLIRTFGSKHTLHNGGSLFRYRYKYYLYGVRSNLRHITWLTSEDTANRFSRGVWVYFSKETNEIVQRIQD